MISDEVLGFIADELAARGREFACATLYELCCKQIRHWTLVLGRAEQDMVAACDLVGCARSAHEPWTTEMRSRRMRAATAAHSVLFRLEYWIERAEFWGREYARAVDAKEKDNGGDLHDGQAGETF